MKVNTKKNLFFLAAGLVLGIALSCLIFFISNLPKKTNPIAKDIPSENEKILSEYAPVYSQRNLKGNCTFEGKIFTSDGVPVKGAIVRLRLKDEPWQTSNLKTEIVTDKEGYYSFENLSEKALYQLFAWSDEKVTASMDNPSCLAQNDLYLEKGANLYLKVLDDNNNIQPNAVINLAGSTIWPMRTGHTDEEGKIKIKGLEPGLYTFNAEAQNNLSYTLPQLLELEATETVELEIRLKNVAPVTLKILDKNDQKPIEKALATLVPQNTTFLTSNSSSDFAGIVSFNNSSDKGNDVSVFAPGYIHHTEKNLYPGDNKEIFLEKGSTISGTVMTPSKTSISGAIVNAMSQNPSISILDMEQRSFIQKNFLASSNGWPDLIPTQKGMYILGPSHIPLPQIEKINKNEVNKTCTDGHFVIDSVPTGTIYLEARHPEYIMQRKPTLYVEPETHLQAIPVLMRQGAKVFIEILTAGKKPISNVEVSFFDNDGQIIYEATTGDDGKILARGLPENITLEIMSQGYATTTKKITAPLGKKTQLSFTLEAEDISLKGRVVDKTGNGVQNVLIQAFSYTAQQDSLLNGITNNTGYFEIEGVTDQDYRIVASIGNKTIAQLQKTRPHGTITLVVDENKQTKLQTKPLTDKDESPSLPTIGESVDTPFGLADSLTVTPSISSPSSTLSSPSISPLPSVAQKGSLPISFSMHKNAVVVNSVQKTSSVYEAGLRQGDRLISIDGQKITTINSAQKALQGEAGTVIIIEVMQEDEHLNIIVQRTPVSSHSN